MSANVCTSHLPRVAAGAGWAMRLGEDLAVGMRQRHAAQVRQRRGDVRRRDGARELTRLDAPAIEDDGHPLVVPVHGPVRRGAAGLRRPVGGHEEPVGLRQDDDIAAAAGIVAQQRGAGVPVACRGMRVELLGEERGGHAGHGPQRAQHLVQRARVAPQPLDDLRFEDQVRALDAHRVRAGPERGFEGALRRLAQERDVEPAGIDPEGRRLFGNRRGAVVGRQRDHVVAGADGAIEVVQQRANRAVEPGERVLHLVTGRAEVVAHVGRAPRS